MLVSDSVFSAGEDGEAIFHPALDLEPRDFAAVQAKMRHRGLRRPTADGRTELLLTPIDLLDLLSLLVTPPRLHRHRYCGVLAPNAALREAVTASAGPAGATLQLLEQARASMGLPAAKSAEPGPPSPLSNLRRAAARCWALLLARIYDCIPLRCSKCGEPMRIMVGCSAYSHD